MLLQSSAGLRAAPPLRNAGAGRSPAAALLGVRTAPARAVERVGLRAPQPLRALARRDLRRGVTARERVVAVRAVAANARVKPDIAVSGGTPEPLGPSRSQDGKGVNFSVFSKRASNVKLCLFLDPEAKEPTIEFTMKRTGDHWHLHVANLPFAGVRYGYRVDGEGGWDAGDRWDNRKIVLDPYGPLVTGRDKFADKSQLKVQWLSSFDFESQPFDWQNVNPPNIPFKDVVIYEMSVRHFTADPSSGLPDDIRGSYLGLIERIPHLKELGINAVELLPIYEYDELEFARLPNPRQHLINAWGYSTMSFFAPMSRFGTGKGAAAAARELKTMVRELHRNGIEVYLDVVYNHTCEGDDTEPYTTSFRAIDNQEYYMLERASGKANFFNYSGCGNTFNANNGAAKRLVLDSLRHWVTEYHIDGFRFDLASALCRAPDGSPMPAPPLIREMSHDPVLGRCKLIAEPWDCGGLYQVGSFPNWDRWAEWNGRYRDDVRRFVKGDPGHKSKLATRLAGSADMYNVNQRKPFHSINFVIAHDGFTLRDLVSYNSKHNEANGEQGRDGCNDNDSWNCGAEGGTSDEGINAQRLRMMKTFHLVLMVSQGTPMMLMGDEYGHTKHGNNNTYGHDSRLSWFQWDALEKEREAFFRFCAKATHFRRKHPLLGRSEFLTSADVTWHEKSWDDPESRFLMLQLHQHGGAGSLLAAFNAHSFAIDPLSVPPPPAGCVWSRVADTQLPSPRDFDGDAIKPIGATYKMAPYSSLLLQAVRADQVPPPQAKL